MYVDAEVQTSDIQSMEDSTAKLANRMQLKRDVFLDDDCKSDQSVRFYTEIPSLAYLFMNFLKPMAAKMKYGICANSQTLFAFITITFLVCSSFLT